MANWPATLPQPSETHTERHLRKVHRTEFETGYELTRPKWTRTRREFELRWTALTQSQKADILEFFENESVFGAYVFDWISPDGETIEVRMVEDSVQFEYVTAGRNESGPLKFWKLQLTLRET